MREKKSTDLTVSMGFFGQKGGTVPKQKIKVMILDRAQMHQKGVSFDLIEKHEDGGLGTVVQEKICLGIYGVVAKVPYSLIALRSKDYMKQLLIDYFLRANIKEAKQQAQNNGIPWTDTLRKQKTQEILLWAGDAAETMLNKETYGEDNMPLYVTFMGQFVEGYSDLGNEVVELIEMDGCAPETVKAKDGVEYELEGLMSIAAMAKILGDPDWLGGSGGNTGYVIEDGCAKAVIVDVGQALTKDKLFFDAYSKDIQIAKNLPKGIQFDKLTEKQKNEYMGTLYSFTHLNDNELHQLVTMLVTREDVYNSNTTNNGVAITLLPDHRAQEMINEIIANVAVLRTTYQDELQQYHEKSLTESLSNPLQDFSLEQVRVTREDVFAPTSVGIDELISKESKKGLIYSPTQKIVALQDLVSRIEDEITHCIKQQEKYPKMERYGHKINVLNATKNYLCGNIEIDILHDYMEQHPKWSKAFGRSNTEMLVEKALELKGKGHTIERNLDM